MSLTFNSFVTALANRMATSASGSNFLTELPNIIDAAEQRCYREVDLQDVRIVDTSAVLTPNSRSFTLPQAQGRFVAIEQINVITPASASVSNGTRVPLIPVSRDSLDQMWPTETAPSTPSVPEFFALLTSQIIRVGGSPDAAYPVEVQGTARPAPLANGNQTTLLSLYLPDLFFAAAMVAGAAYQKSFGAQADDPKVAMSWEATYQTAAKSAIVEEFKKKFAGSAWTSMATPPDAQPPRN